MRLIARNLALLVLAVASYEVVVAVEQSPQPVRMAKEFWPPIHSSLSFDVEFTDSATQENGQLEIVRSGPRKVGVQQYEAFDQRFQKVLGNATFTESYRYAAKAGVVKLDSSRDRPEGREILVLPRRLSPGFTWTLHYFDGDETHRVDNTSLTWTIEGKPLSCVLISFDGIRSNRPMHGHEVYCPGWGMVEEEQQHGNTHLLIRLRGARPGGSGQESKVQPQGSRPPG